MLRFFPSIKYAFAPELLRGFHVNARFYPVCIRFYFCKTNVLNS